MSELKNRPVVLVFLSHYLPGYLAGGPIRTVASVVEMLSDDFDFRIVCSDRDLGDKVAYPGMPLNCWLTVGRAQVYYVSSGSGAVFEFARLMRDTRHDLVYLNSAFDPAFTLRPLLARRLLGAASKPFLLAPRGEFGAGAISLKALKKRVFLMVAKAARLYSGTRWHASSVHEVDDIHRVFPGAVVDVAIDLANLAVRSSASVADVGENGFSDCSGLKLLFLSRIVPKKNLSFALQVLRGVKSRVSMSIVGPKEDPAYWSQCEKLIGDLPRNVNVRYCGVVAPDEVASAMAAHDIFFLPTRNENFGHVIAEALAVGTPVLISDQTPWRELVAGGAGWDLPLDSTSAFSKVIDEFASRAFAGRAQMRESVLRFAQAKLIDPVALEANRQLFFRAVAQVDVAGERGVTDFNGGAK